MLRQLTDEDALNMPAAVRRMLKSQCGGEWNRLTVDQDGAYTVWNSPAQAAMRAAAAAPARPAVRKPRKPPAAPPPPAAEPVRTPVRDVSPPPPAIRTLPKHSDVRPERPAVERPASSRREKNAEAAALQALIGSKAPAPPTPGVPVADGVKVVSAPARPHEELALWSADPKALDWSGIDVDASAAKLRDQLIDGLPDRIPFKFLPDVLALYGMDLQILESAIRHPYKVEVRPETRQKKYPVLAFYRGDVVAILGMREPTQPMVIAAYAVSKLDHDSLQSFGTHGGGTGGGGARKRDGLPGTVRAMLRAIRSAGADVDLSDPGAQVAEVTYRGQCLGKVSVGSPPRTTVESDYQRVIRKIHAIDQRKVS